MSAKAVVSVPTCPVQCDLPASACKITTEAISSLNTSMQIIACPAGMAAKSVANPCPIGCMAPSETIVQRNGSKVNFVMKSQKAAAVATAASAVPSARRLPAKRSSVVSAAAPSARSAASAATADFRRNPMSYHPTGTMFSFQQSVPEAEGAQFQLVHARAGDSTVVLATRVDKAGSIASCMAACAVTSTGGFRTTSASLRCMDKTCKMPTRRFPRKKTPVGGQIYVQTPFRRRHPLAPSWQTVGGKAIADKHTRRVLPGTT